MPVKERIARTDQAEAPRSTPCIPSFRKLDTSPTTDSSPSAMFRSEENPPSACQGDTVPEKTL
jgi:hypothetical protein